MRTGVDNFFENISDVWSFVNNVLQAKPAEAVDTLFRVTTNTLWGLGGIFDVASEMKIPKHKEDFGQTLGTWGLKSGPYVVLPLFGPSSVRDSAGLVVDLQGNPLSQVDNVPVRNSLTGLRLVDTRASLLRAGDLLDQAALDKYAFTRDAYLQRRQSLIGGGNERSEPEERFDLPEAAPAGAPAASAPNPTSVKRLGNKLYQIYRAALKLHRLPVKQACKIIIRARLIAMRGTNVLDPAADSCLF